MAGNQAASTGNQYDCFFNDPLYGGSGSRSPSHGLKAGKIVAQGTPDALKTKYAYDSMALVFHNTQEGAKFLEENAISFTENQGIYTIRLTSTLQALPLLKEAEPLIASFEVIKGSMDDVFLHIMAEEEVA